jgi:putative transposase
MYKPGGTYFFTIVTYQRRPMLTQPDSISILKNIWLETITKRPVELIAYCILPDHLHCVWSMPEDDLNFPVRWSAIKGKFTIQYHQRYPEENETRIWENRYWEHLIRDEQDLNRHIDYIHYNPIKHGLVNKPVDWKLSSFSEYLANGFYSEDWLIEGKAQDNWE